MPSYLSARSRFSPGEWAVPYILKVTTQIFKRKNVLVSYETSRSQGRVCYFPYDNRFSRILSSSSLSSL